MCGMEGLSADTVPALSSWRSFTRDGTSNVFQLPQHWTVCCIRALDTLCGNLCILETPFSKSWFLHQTTTEWQLKLNTFKGLKQVVLRGKWTFLLRKQEGTGLCEEVSPTKYLRESVPGGQWNREQELQSVFVFYRRTYACKTHQKDSVRTCKPLSLVLLLFNLYV